MKRVHEWPNVAAQSRLERASERRLCGILRVDSRNIYKADTEILAIEDNVRPHSAVRRVWKTVRILIPKGSWAAQR